MIGKISLGLNILLIIAVGYLFMNQTAQVESSELSNDKQIEASNIQTQPAIEGLKVAHIRGDSLSINYKYVADEQDKLIAKKNASERKINREAKKFEDERNKSMKYAESGSASQEDLRVMENQLMQMEYQIQQLAQIEQNKLAEAEFEFQNNVISRITKYVKEYGEENGYDIILNWESTASGVLYSNEQFDVTSDIVNGLNAEYLEELGPESVTNE